MAQHLELPFLLRLSRVLLSADKQLFLGFRMSKALFFLQVKLEGPLRVLERLSRKRGHCRKLRPLRPPCRLRQPPLPGERSGSCYPSTR